MISFLSLSRGESRDCADMQTWTSNPVQTRADKNEKGKRRKHKHTNQTTSIGPYRLWTVTMYTTQRLEVGSQANTGWREKRTFLTTSKCKMASTFYRRPKIPRKRGLKRSIFGRIIFWCNFSWLALALPTQSLKYLYKEMPPIIFTIALCPVWSSWWLMDAR